jgi:hypothetical protein
MHAVASEMHGCMPGDKTDKATCDGPTAHAHFGSLTEMKRHMSLPAIHLKEFQPLHFTWQPYRKETP